MPVWNFLKNALFVALVMLLSRVAQAEWLYHFGTNPTDYDAQGIPLALSSTLVPIDDVLWNKITTALPESRDIRLVNPDYITDDNGANILLEEEGEVFVTFMHEGAGFRNSFGYFTYTGDHPTDRSQIQEVVIFPNASYWNAGGSANGLRSGHQVNLGTFPAGTRIGFFVAANGYNGAHGVSQGQSSPVNFYTIKSFNAENDELLSAHTVLLHDDETNKVVLGFEDINRTLTNCDQDFNDVVFMVETNPPTAIDYLQLQKLPEVADRDGDGILDANDDYPDDANRAFDMFYPSSTRKGTLAFEDQWPGKGDYDFNDLVVSYQVRETVNAAGNIVDIQMNFEILARGAALGSSFAVAFDKVAPGLLASANLSVNDAPPQVITAQDNQDRLVLQVFGNSFEHTPDQVGCDYFNTETNCTAQSASRFQLNMGFTSAQPRSAIGPAPYNPYIAMFHAPSIEVHLPDHEPTFRAGAELFGSQDDNSNLPIGRSYRTINNLPWALDIPYPWCHPAEYQDIAATYSAFASWAQSNGALDKDWYTRDFATTRRYSCN